MKTHKIIGLILTLCIHSAFAVMPEGGTGGNGQLVVVPQKGSKPVPYEVARSWDTGVYRNFYKMPGVNGSTEARSRFNKNYGVHALEWMKLIKEYSPALYKDLDNAAKTTLIRFMDNLIIWEHEAYPKDGTDYKKFEKAAFFNGEIIFSIPVMEKIGPLENILTREENQGFVVIHELINAAFKSRYTVAQRLTLGEIIANIKIQHSTKEEFHLELIQRLKESTFLTSQEDSLFIFSLIKTMGHEVFENSPLSNARYPYEYLISDYSLFSQSKDLNVSALKKFDETEGNFVFKFYWLFMALFQQDNFGLTNNDLYHTKNLLSIVEFIIENRLKDQILDLSEFSLLDINNHREILINILKIIREERLQASVSGFIDSIKKIPEDFDENLLTLNSMKWVLESSNIYSPWSHSSEFKKIITQNLAKTGADKIKLDFNEDLLSLYAKESKTMMLKEKIEKIVAQKLNKLGNPHRVGLFPGTILYSQNKLSYKFLKHKDKNICNFEESGLTNQDKFVYHTHGKILFSKKEFIKVKVIESSNESKINKTYKLDLQDVSACNIAVFE